MFDAAVLMTEDLLVRLCTTLIDLKMCTCIIGQDISQSV